jgi:hypothetical protein
MIILSKKRILSAADTICAAHDANHHLGSEQDALCLTDHAVRETASALWRRTQSNQIDLVLKLLLLLPGSSAKIFIREKKAAGGNHS